MHSAPADPGSGSTEQAACLPARSHHGSPLRTRPARRMPPCMQPLWLTSAKASSQARGAGPPMRARPHSRLAAAWPLQAPSTRCDCASSAALSGPGGRAPRVARAQARLDSAWGCGAWGASRSCEVSAANSAAPQSLEKPARVGSSLHAGAGAQVLRSRGHAHALLHGQRHKQCSSC